MLYKDSFWGQNGGPSFFGALSAIDIALWDIKGKAFGVPVCQLLGGRYRDEVRCYASHVQYGWDQKTDPDWLAAAGGPKQEDYAVRAREAVKAGFDAVKLDIWEYDRDGTYYPLNYYQKSLCGKQLENLEERLAGIRDAVGTETDVILDAHALMSVPAAVQFSEIARKYHVFYLEEPTASIPKLVKQLSGRAGIPLAYGERIYSGWQFAPYLESGMIQVAQPDIGNTGGFTEIKKICASANIHDISVQPHTCASPLLVAATLQIEAVIPNFMIHEYYFEQQTQYMQTLCKYTHIPENGFLRIPDRPGIGNEWSEYFLETAKTISIEK